MSHFLWPHFSPSDLYGDLNHAVTLMRSGRPDKASEVLAEVRRTLDKHLVSCAYVAYLQGITAARNGDAFDAAKHVAVACGADPLNPHYQEARREIFGELRRQVLETSFNHPLVAAGFRLLADHGEHTADVQLHAAHYHLLSDNYIAPSAPITSPHLEQRR
jgi:hypothetical protein